MNPAQLLAYFNHISDTPDAIPRLRRFIRDLAVRGRLVAPDPKDKPGSQWRGCPDAVQAGTPPYGLPGSWAWVKVGDIAECRLGKMLDKAGNKGLPRRYLRNVNVRWFDFDLSNVLEMRFEDRELGEFALRRGDVLICEGGEPGRAAVWDARETDLYFQKALHRVRLPKDVNPHFFVNVLRSRAESGRLVAYLTGVGIKHLTGKGLAAFTLPLPPLAEQDRIVAKLNELMALCDRLEAARADGESWRDRLMVASLRRLIPGDADSPYSREHARFHLRHLPRITTRREQIQELRQTILALAIRGHLVRQDPKDEPASELLKRIVREKDRLVGDSRLRGATAVTPPQVGTALFALPAAWAWVPFGDITISRDGERVPVSKEERNRRAKTYDYYGASGVIDKIDGFLFDKPLLLIGEDGANLINRSTPIAFIASGKYWVNNHAHVLDGISEGFLQFIKLYINAIDLKPYLTGTAQPKMNQAKMNSIPVALPPLDEQSRIVAKVTELMAVCDKLEGQLTTVQDERRRLFDAVLANALGSVA